MSFAHAHATEVDTASFDREVVEASRRLPVVVDFWAPWCAPCRALGPVLERLAHEADGAWRLVKVNTDASPELARAHNIRGIPAVKAFRDGEVVSEFVGALPESSVRKWLEGFLPGPADAIVAEAEARQRAGDAAGAEVLFQRALEVRPRHAGALLGLSRLCAHRGDAAAATRWLDLLGPDDAVARARDVAQVRLAISTGGADLPALEERVRAHPEDADARRQLAAALAARGHWEEALEGYLHAVRAGRGDVRDEARKGMLEVFDIVGPRSELAERYRALLARELYK
jgi:putative thioredoxin